MKVYLYRTVLITYGTVDYEEWAGPFHKWPETLTICNQISYNIAIF